MARHGGHTDLLEAGMWSLSQAKANSHGNGGEAGGGVELCFSITFRFDCAPISGKKKQLISLQFFYHKKLFVLLVKMAESYPMAGTANQGSIANTKSCKADTRKGLGLRMNKTRELIASIGAKLMQVKDELESFKRIRAYKSRPLGDKLSVSLMPARRLEIGGWEKAVHSDGDIGVKFYFNTKKLVWEVIDQGAKKRVEIPWGRISALRATFRQGEHSTLEVELAEPPEFSFGYAPGPWNHLFWMPTPDFTYGEAQRCRRHTVTFAEGILEGPYQKLVHSNGFLFISNHRPYPFYNSDPFFKSQYPDTPSMGRILVAVPLTSVHPPVAAASRATTIPNGHQFSNFGNMNIPNDPDVHDGRMKTPATDHNTNMGAMHNDMASHQLNNSLMQMPYDEPPDDAHMSNTAMDAMHTDLASFGLDNSQMQVFPDEQDLYVGSFGNQPSNGEENTPRDASLRELVFGREGRDKVSRW